MIPTIEDIAKGLQDGSICYADAVAWLNQHAEFTDEKYQRYETFKAVALAKINELELDHVRHYAAGVANPEVEFLGRLSEGCFLRFSNITEAILAGAQEFSTKGKVGR